MSWSNNAARIRREVLVRTARLAFEGRLEEGAERIAYEMTGPGWETVRCCLHHDRAIIRLRVMAALGFSPQGLEVADRPLSEYAAEAKARALAGPAPRRARDAGGSFLSINDEACNACVRTRHRVTEACQACLARPCRMGCPKGAVSFREGRAWIDPDKCVDCGLCLKSCPFSAIIKQSVPCEEACPAGAIAKDGEGRERIDESRCIECGKCLKACPFGAVSEATQAVDLALALAAGTKATLLLAPAMAVQFPGGFARLSAAAKRLGFARVVEAARGADETARLEAAELAHRKAAGRGFMTSSCCPAWARAARLAGPALAARLSDTPSPMRLGAAALKAEEPGSLMVFAGPCAAKRREGAEDGNVDYVITAEELGALLVAAGVDVAAEEPAAAPPGERPSPEARLFAVSGGVAAAVAAATAKAGLPSFKAVTVDGLKKASLRQAESWEKTAPEADLVEVMACEGGCAAGPCALANPRTAAAQLAAFAKAQ